jgi:hypothetical protein
LFWGWITVVEKLDLWSKLPAWQAGRHGWRGVVVDEKMKGWENVDTVFELLYVVKWAVFLLGNGARMRQPGSNDRSRQPV